MSADTPGSLAPYDEERLQPISALQHLRFCERRCALVHLEGIWQDNRFTVEGRELHQRVHDEGQERRPGLRIARGLRLRSLAHGLTGCADVVEFTTATSEDPAGETVALPGVAGRWRPTPVEYKRGRNRADQCYDVQLCAQVLCLEEMLDVHIPQAAIYQGKTRRRATVPIDDALRGETVRLIARLHELLAAGITPPPRYDRRCESCSLRDRCLPGHAGSRPRAQNWLENQIGQAIDKG